MILRADEMPRQMEAQNPTRDAIVLADAEPSDAILCYANPSRLHVSPEDAPPWPNR
jgi:hypothetical protein